MSDPISVIFLFQNQTTDANSTAQIVGFPTKRAVIKAWGTWNGGAIKVQTLAPQTSPAVWIDVPDMNGNTMSFTANGQRNIAGLIQNEQIRAVQSGSGGSTSLTVSLEIS